MKWPQFMSFWWWVKWAGICLYCLVGIELGRWCFSQSNSISGAIFLFLILDGLVYAVFGFILFVTWTSIRMSKDPAEKKKFEIRGEKKFESRGGGIVISEAMKCRMEKERDEVTLVVAGVLIFVFWIWGIKAMGFWDTPATWWSLR